jgi:hypothetical protein
MQNDILKIWITVMPMIVPTVGTQIDFDVATCCDVIADLQNGPPKIRPGFVVPKTGMKNSHRSSVQRPQLIAKEALMVPNNLKQLFGEWRGGLAQEESFAASKPPVGVKICSRRGHRHCFSTAAFAKSSLRNLNRAQQLLSSRL